MAKPKSCQWRGLNAHATRDAIQFSDAAVQNQAFALFKKGHNVTCKCMAEGGKPEDCDALYVTDENGEHLATLHGANLRARQLENKSIAVYRAAVQTGDAALDAAVVEIKNRLARYNADNEKFYARGPEKW